MDIKNKVENKERRENKVLQLLKPIVLKSKYIKEYGFLIDFRLSDWPPPILLAYVRTHQPQRPDSHYSSQIKQTPVRHNAYGNPRVTRLNVINDYSYQL